MCIVISGVNNNSVARSIHQVEAADYKCVEYISPIHDIMVTLENSVTFHPLPLVGRFSRFSDVLSYVKRKFEEAVRPQHSLSETNYKAALDFLVTELYEKREHLALARHLEKMIILQINADYEEPTLVERLLNVNLYEHRSKISAVSYIGAAGAAAICMSKLALKMKSTERDLVADLFCLLH